MQPAWQTDELEEEWVDQGSEGDHSASIAHNASDLSLTQPIGSVLEMNGSDDESSSSTSQKSPSPVGTFLVREDEPALAILPKTPGKANKSLVKDFFSPLALERMFDPPSPPSKSTPLPILPATTPAIPSRLSQMYIPSPDASQDSVKEEEDKEQDYLNEEESLPSNQLPQAVPDCQFTFAPPPPFHPDAQSTPGPGPAHPLLLNVPSTDPRLRLFHFQYDTFTRDHLSAMVDSIAINTPSGGSDSTPNTGPSPSDRYFDADGSLSRLRSAKRIKLSPASDYSPEGDGNARIMRPKNGPKDYLGESKHLMERIRQNRDFSTISTTASQSPTTSRKGDTSKERLSHNSNLTSRLTVPSTTVAATREISSAWTATSSKPYAYSSLGYREQAANLMAQIRSDVKSSKRIFSTDTDLSRATHPLLDHQQSPPASVQDEPSFEHEGDTEILPDSVNRADTGIKISSDPTNFSQNQTGKLSRTSTDELTRSLAQVSLDSQALLEQFPAPPVDVVTTPPTPAQTVIVLSPNGNSDPSRLAAPGMVPAYPSSSIQSGRNEDLTRFVSSSTASGTTLTTGSAGSSTKFQGSKHITHIAPGDIPALPERVGKMVFDKVMMKWVKATALATAGSPDDAPDDEVAEADNDNESEDPFRDIESLREEDSGGIDNAEDKEESHHAEELEKSRIEVIESEVEDEEEVELTSFSFDGLSMEAAAGTATAGYDHLDETLSDDDHQEGVSERILNDSALLPAEDSYFEFTETQEAQVPQPDETVPALQDSPPSMLAPPIASASTPIARSTQPAVTPIIRSVLKSNSVTPVSALAKHGQSRVQTPAQRLVHRRSVSFSDGRRDGPILGIGRNVPTPDGTTTDSGADDDNNEDYDAADTSGKTSSGSIVPSARSKRIAEMLEGLEDSVFEDDSPSKASSVRPPADELQPLKSRKSSASSTSAVVGNAIREASSRSLARATSIKQSRISKGNATFLTECSFGVAHDRLVKVITDVQPFEPYWDELSAIDLSKKNLDSVARLKEILPRLDLLSLNSNQIAWLSGVPSTVRTLSVVSNCLTGVTSFSHLLSLENLDISNNNLDSLCQLECLRHLRELRADGNRINSVDGLEKMDGLVKLSLQKNSIRSIDLANHSWTRLEMLNLSYNNLSAIYGLSSLPALIALNLDNNKFTEFKPDGPMPRLRILRVSGNRLQQLNATSFPNLRTLYADNNNLCTIQKTNRLTKLENLSLRNQGGRLGMNLDTREVRDVKRMYLSGNPTKPGFISEPCYNLVYLEVAACRFSVLPQNFSQLVPNLRVLNLNYNFLEDTRPLEGLTRLRKLTIIGSRLKSTKQLVRVLRGMLEIEMLDFRMNPCTLGWYLPLLVKDVPGALQPSDVDDHSKPSSNQARKHKMNIERDGEHIQNSSKTRNDRNHETNSKGPIAFASSSSQQQSSPENFNGGVGEESSRVGTGSVGLVWKDLDSKFRRDLPDDAYVGRLVYRGLVMRACPAIRILDGLEVSDKERDKAERLLQGLEGKRKGRIEEEKESPAAE